MTFNFQSLRKASTIEDLKSVKTFLAVLEVYIATNEFTGLSDELQIDTTFISCS